MALGAYLLGLLYALHSVLILLLALKHKRSDKMRELSELELEMVDGGFSLPEISVSTGIVAVVALGSVKLSSDVKKAEYLLIEVLTAKGSGSFDCGSRI